MTTFLETQQEKAREKYRDYGMCTMSHDDLDTLIATTISSTLDRVRGRVGKFVLVKDPKVKSLASKNRRIGIRNAVVKEILQTLNITDI